LLSLHGYSYVNKEDNKDDDDDAFSSYDTHVIFSIQIITLLFFVVTTQIFSADSVLRTQPDDCGLDIKYPHVFISGIQLTQLLSVFLLIVPDLLFSSAKLTTNQTKVSTSSLLVVVVISFVQFLWILIYPFFSNSKHGVCCVKSIFSLRLGASAMVFVTAYLTLRVRSVHPDTDNEFMRWALCMIIILFLSFLSFMYITHKTSIKNRKEIEKSGLLTTIHSLTQINGKLCIEDAVNKNWSIENKRKDQGWLLKIKKSNSPSQLGILLLEFEEQVLIERINKKFINQRLLSWRNDVSQANSFNEINILAKEFLKYLKMPPFASFVNKLVKEILKEKKSARYECSRITEFVVGDAWKKKNEVIRFQHKVLSLEQQNLYDKGGIEFASKFLTKNKSDKPKAITFSEHIAKSAVLLDEFRAEKFIGRNFMYVPPKNSHHFYNNHNSRSNNNWYRNSNNVELKAYEAYVVELLPHNKCKIQVETLQDPINVSRIDVRFPISDNHKS
jgi:hypothetical protein